MRSLIRVIAWVGLIALSRHDPEVPLLPQPEAPVVIPCLPQVNAPTELPLAAIQTLLSGTPRP